MVYFNKTYRISHRGCSVKKGVLRNFAKVTRKHLRQRLISNKAARLEFFFKNSLWHKCFSVNFAKFLRTLLLQSTTGQLLLSSLLLYYFELLFTAICYHLHSEFLFNQPVAWYFFNKRLAPRWFLVNFAKMSKSPLLKTTLGLLLLCLLDISVLSQYLMLISQTGFSNRLRHYIEMINIEMCTCEIKIRWTWEFFLFLHFWFCKIAIKCG